MNELKKDEQGLVKTSEYTSVNPQFMSSQGLQQAQNFAGIPQTITSDVLGGNQTPINLPTPTPSTTATGVNASIVAQGKNAAQQSQDEYNQALTNYQTQQQTKTTESEAGIKGLMNQILGKSQEKIAAEEQAGIPKLNTEIADINNRINEAEGARLAEITALDKQIMTASAKQTATNDINRKYAIQQLTEGVMLAAKTNNLTALQNNINKKIELELEPLKLQYDFETKVLANNMDSLTKAEQATLQAKADETKRILDNAYKTLTSIGDFAKTAAANGAPAEVISAVANAKTMEEAITAAGQYAGDVLDRQIKQAQLANIYSQISERSPSGNSGDYTAKQMTALTKLNQDVSKNATYAKTTSMRNYGDNVTASLSQGTGVGDIAAINQFQKVIDEGAVTRDQDVKLIQGAQSLANTLKTKLKKLEKGDALSPELRTQMRQTVDSLYEAQVKALLKDPYISAKTKEAEIYKLKPGDTILGELGTFSNTSTQTVKSNGMDWVVGQVYNDGMANWVIDAQGNWSKQ